MKKVLIGALAALFILAAGADVAHAITIRLGSVAPRQSVYGEALERMAADWARISNGQIQIRIFHNGIAGDMGDMVQKMRIRQLDAGVFVSSGMSIFSEKIMTLSMPFLIRDDAELTYVMSRVRDELEAAVAQRGFKVLAWSQAGWVKFFGREPIVYPDDLRDMRIASNPDEPELLRMWQILGFNPVGVPMSETLSALNTGMVNALYANGLGAAGYQWFGVANYMTDMNIAPFLGAIIMDARVWERIPDNLKPALERSMRQMQDRLDQEVLELEQDAIETMQRFGLEIVDVPAAAERAWRRMAEQAAGSTVGSLFDRELYDTIVRLLEEYRSR